MMLSGLQIGLDDAVQIAIIAAVLYHLLVFLRGTRSAQMLLGIGALALLLIGMTYVFRFDVLGWLLSALSVYLAVGIVIVFQPEIRRALAMLGGRSLFGHAVAKADVAAKLAGVVETLSVQRVGALIAIEGEVALKSFIESGVYLDAPLVPELLASLFFPHTPLHDGGAIIRVDRILAASCVFPLAQRADLSGLGTRHRAAIGLSEETDAVVIVVSEETGRVSLVHEGRIYRNLKQPRLLRYLHVLLPEGRRNELVFRRTIETLVLEDLEDDDLRAPAKGMVSDWPWKVLALFVATVIYLMVRSRISHVQTVAVPVEIEREPGIAVLTVEPLSVRVTFRGAAADIQRLPALELKAVLRPHVTARGGRERVQVSGRDIRGRGALRIVELDPKVVLVTYDRQGQVAFPVAEPVVEGKPLRGRVQIDYSPRTAVVTGARLHLDQSLTNGVQLQTEPVDVEGRLQGFTRRLRILPPDGVWMTEVQPPEVTARISIVADRSTSELRDVPVLVAQSPGDTTHWQPDPPVVSIRLSARAEIIQSIRMDVVRAFVDARLVAAAPTNGLPVFVYLPPEVAVETAETEPRQVRLRRVEGR
jgi:diadenylate cyclase